MVLPLLSVHFNGLTLCVSIHPDDLLRVTEMPRPLIIGAFSETDVDTKKTPKQSTRLGVLSCCLNLRL